MKKLIDTWPGIGILVVALAALGYAWAGTTV